MGAGADFQSSAAKSPEKERNDGDAGADGRLAWQYERSANRQET